MSNNLLRDKTSMGEFIVSTCLMTALLFFTGLVHVHFGSYSIDALLGWSMLVAFAGMSTYSSAIPGLLIGIIWGLLGGSDLHIVVNILTVFFGMYAYMMLSHLRQLSPLNVYEAAIAGSVFHSVLSFAFNVTPCVNLLALMVIELVVSLGTFKFAVNKVRKLGFINHEDPVLVAKIERDWIQEAYNKVNQKFNTNFQRPSKPNNN
jgi:hypothetical protein